MENFVVSSPAFEEGGLIPVEYTGYGRDISPALVLDGLSGRAVSIAVILDDMNHPIPAYNHWIIWNIQAMSRIPAEIPHGAYVESLGNAVQGCGYGKNRYRGPKPPFHWSHVYRFSVYVLDCRLDLSPAARKRNLLAAVKGHVLQKASLSGHYR